MQFLMKWTLSVVHDFASEVFNRFSNPYINAHLGKYCQNYSAKIKLRCIPILMKHYEKSDVGT